MEEMVPTFKTETLRALLDNPYECDGCGACCRSSIVELCDVDFQRESRLIPLARVASISIHLNEGKTEIGELRRYQALAMLTDQGERKCCSFLGEDNRCTIYPTRPGSCITYQAGSDKCQEVRKREGLPPLEPKAEPQGTNQ